MPLRLPRPANHPPRPRPHWAKRNERPPPPPRHPPPPPAPPLGQAKRMPAPPASTQPLRCDHGLRRQAIVESLLADVFQGRLRAGQHLVTQQLATRFGVSHTPIREALISLAGIGILDLLPNKGAVVRAVTSREIREICQVRRVLECQATRSAGGRLALAELHAIAAELRWLRSQPSPNWAEFIDRARAVDSRLHDTIAASCGNAFLAQE